MSSTPLSPVRKAIVPVAGLGTRLFPASHAVKKEMFPVVGPDGIARALFHYHLLELADAGISEVCIIVQPGEEKTIRTYLEGPDEAYLKRLEKHPALHAEALRMRGFAERVRFAVQSEQEGYGHAVYQARAFADGEPCLLCLGDHLFRGSSTSPCALLAQAWNHSGGRSVSAVNRISPAQLKGYGTIAGKRLPDNPQIIEVSRIIEKPSVEIARQQLRVDGLGNDEFLGWFGMHVLAPSIFDVLAAMIRDDTRDNGEFQLTRAQEIQRQNEGYLAMEMTGCRRFDFGTPEDYVAALADFARAD
jgi:UTP--glucose-1-phosphate uridylyltransferase